MTSQRAAMAGSAAGPGRLRPRDLASIGVEGSFRRCPAHQLPYQVRDQTRVITNTQNEHPERTPRCGACVRPGQCRSGCPSPPPPVPLAVSNRMACTRLPSSTTRRLAGLRYGTPPPRPFALTSLRSATQFPSPSDVRRPTSDVQRTRCEGCSFDARPDRGSAACPPASSEPAPAKAGGTVLSICCCPAILSP